MSKAKILSHEERLQLTSRKFNSNSQVVIPEKYTRENSPFLKMREELQLNGEHTCPMCGGVLVRYEGCYRCKKCGWSKC